MLRQALIDDSRCNQSARLMVSSLVRPSAVSGSVGAASEPKHRRIAAAKFFSSIAIGLRSIGEWLTQAPRQRDYSFKSRIYESGDKPSCGLSPMFSGEIGLTRSGGMDVFVTPTMFPLAPTVAFC
ncbi:MAG: hypothetical protein JO166_17475 [Deltaproteobacteria bacterium]|nr:hypothetical protein [Deltaproteobacteria bacterium]